MTSALERARTAFEQRAWGGAHDAFAAAAEEAVLDVADSERLAIAAYLVGADERCEQAWEAAYRAALETGDVAAAARCAVLLALCLVLRGQMARAGGWLGRSERLLAESGIECPASGYVLIPKAFGALEAGESDAAHELSILATDIGRKFDDRDLCALGLLAQGQALIAMGSSRSGIATLDQVMVSVTSGETGPVVTGIAYCLVIVECLRRFDLARATEWTAALSAWCDAQPDLVPFRGQCLVHRSQLQQAAGRWADALALAAAACRHLTDPPHPALGLAHYQQAELHRLTGDFERAEAQYRGAARHGHDPVPGIALLELMRGDVAAAVTAIRRALREPGVRLDRPALLSAAVDIFRAAGDLEALRDAAGELAEMASSSSQSLLSAMAAHAAGSVLFAEGDQAGALADLRVAARLWHSLHVPYEAARTAVLLGLACAALGDRTSAALEFHHAEAAFTELGARPDLERLARLSALLVDDAREAGAGDLGDQLSDREREVLAHLAAGKTNLQIAAALTISRHTVGRHVENIFAKLGVTSRAAATAYAYERDLLSTRRSPPEALRPPTQ